MEVTAFNRLEQKIDDILNQLDEQRRLNSELREQLAVKERRVAELEEQNSAQDQEKEEVRQRIEQLVLKLETY
jgi:cell division protein ZapB